MTTQVPGGIQENRVRTTLQSLCDDVAALGPGGSNTQIQYNNSGAFAGSAKMTFDGTNVVIDMPSGLVSLGDVNNTGNGAKIIVDDSTGNFDVYGVLRTRSFNASHEIIGGNVSIGDPTNISGNGWFSGFTVDVSNVVLTLFSPSGQCHMGDYAAGGNSTVLTVDDANSRATFNKKFIVSNGGAFYVYDSGTSTYWKWESVNGVWTGTDTTSGSLP